MTEPPPLIHIEVLFKTNDPRGKQILDEINAIPQFTPERAEAEWFLYSMLARVAARRADRYRETRRQADQRQQRSRARLGKLHDE